MRRPIVTISGDRQTGKTHAALAVAAVDAMLGRAVHYQGHSSLYVRNAQKDLLDCYLSPSLVSRALFSNGREAIELETDGRIDFQRCIPRRGEKIWRGSTDTFIFDDADIPYGFVEDNPNAHIYVTVVPPGGDVCER